MCDVIDGPHRKTKHAAAENGDKADGNSYRMRRVATEVSGVRHELNIH